MNRPTMRSTPGSSGGRPDTIAPNTTSSRPVSRDSRTPQSAWSTVLTVTPRRRASLVSVRVSSASSSIHTFSGGTGTVTAGATRVGSSRPSRARSHASRAAARS